MIDGFVIGTETGPAGTTWILVNLNDGILPAGGGTLTWQAGAQNSGSYAFTMIQDQIVTGTLQFKPALPHAPTTFDSFTITGNPMTLATSQSGTIQTIASLDGVSVNATLQPAGNTVQKPIGSLPAAAAGTVSSVASCQISVPTGSLIVGQLVAIFWTVAGVLNAIYDATVSAVTTASPNDTVTLTNTTGTLTGANYYASSGSAPTTLPAAATVINVSVAQDVTNSVSIVGADLQQLLITSTQPGLCELFDATPTQRLVEPILASGSFYSWPQSAGQAVPFSQTVTKCRMYNNGLTAATMTVAALLA